MRRGQSDASPRPAAKRAAAASRGCRRSRRSRGSPPGRPAGASPASRLDDRRPPRARTRRVRRRPRWPSTSSASERRCASGTLPGRWAAATITTGPRPAKAPREVVLEHARARGVGARLEDGDQPAAPPAPSRAARAASRARRSDGARSRRRPTTPRTRAAHLQPPLHAAEGGERRARGLRAPRPTAAGRGQRGQRVAHVVLARRAAA